MVNGLPAETRVAALRRISPENIRNDSGRALVNRDGIAEALDLVPRTVKHRAATDPAFPDPIEPPRRGRSSASVASRKYH